MSSATTTASSSHGSTAVPSRPSSATATRWAAPASGGGGPSSSRAHRSAISPTAGATSGSRRSTPCPACAIQPRTTAPGGGRSAGRAPPAPAVVGQRDAGRRVVADGHDQRVGRRVDPLDGHGRGRPRRDQVPPAERDGDPGRRAVLELDHREAAAVRHRVDGLHDVAPGDPDRGLHDRHPLDGPLADGGLDRRRVPAVLGGDPPVEGGRAVGRHDRPPRRDPTAPRCRRALRPSRRPRPCPGAADGSARAGRGTSRQPTGRARGLPLLTRTLARVRAAVLVPVKGFGAAKRRLAGVLGPTERAELARRMAERVVAAAAPLPVHVVCDDDEVADWAERAGTQVLWRPGHGLNGAIADGLASLAKLGVDPRRHRPRRPAAGARPGLADRARRDHPRARPPRRRHQRRRPAGRPCPSGSPTARARSATIAPRLRATGSASASGATLGWGSTSTCRTTSPGRA